MASFINTKVLAGFVDEGVSATYAYMRVGYRQYTEWIRRRANTCYQIARKMISKSVCLPLSDLGQHLAADGIHIKYNALWKLTTEGRLKTRRRYGRVLVVGSWPAICDAVRRYGPKPCAKRENPDFSDSLNN